MLSHARNTPTSLIYNMILANAKPLKCSELASAQLLSWEHSSLVAIYYGPFISMHLSVQMLSVLVCLIEEHLNDIECECVGWSTCDHVSGDVFGAHGLLNYCWRSCEILCRNSIALLGG